MSGEPSGPQPAPGRAAALALVAQTVAAARPPYVIDTSVVLDWYIAQARPAEARRYLEDGVERHAPDLMPVEAAHALLKRARGVGDPVRHLPLADADSVRALVEAAPVQLHSSLPLNALAFALAVEIGASHYEGLFLALAIRIDGQVVTADRKLHDKVRASSYADRARWVADPPRAEKTVPSQTVERVRPIDGPL